MKISINSTYSYIRTNINYGSTLQCYALQKYLKKRGHDPEHLRDYRANPVLILKRLKNIKWFKPFCAKAVAQFEMGRFIKDNIAVSTKGYISEKAMYKNCPKADCFIAGSDQIWRNPTGSRFLNYAPDEAIKLSYAASFGRTSLPKEIAEKIKPWLNRFDGISVREKTAVNMVKSIVDKEVVQVLDPTLLLDMDEYPYANIEEKNYCYCYFLNLGDKKNVSFDEIKRYAADENMKLIVTSPSNYTLFLNENPIFPTVEKWLGLYKNANCIFTNTYHGMLFCIISMRENRGSEIVKELTGLDVPVILDPVFNFNKEQWEKLIPVKKEMNEPYIFAYFLGANPEYRKQVQKLAESTGLKIVALRHMDQYVENDEAFGDYAPYDVAPDRFLNFIRGAEYVCTDSFHGTCFSIINEKKFMIFNRYANASATSKNSRIDSLCQNLGVSERRFSGDILEIQKDINYAEVKNNLNNLQQKTIEYLDAALSQ